MGERYDWNDTAEMHFLAVELPANIITRNWGWRRTYQNYIDALDLRVDWWPGAEPDALREFASSLRDWKPHIRVIDDRHVVVTYEGKAHTVIVPVPMQIKGPAIEAGGFRTGKPLSRGFIN